MTSPTRDVVSQWLRESGAVEEAALQGLLRQLSPGTPTEELCRRCVETGLLSSYQTSLILEDRMSALLIGNYVLRRQLGEGGMGQVFEAWHRRMRRVVALKLISPKIVQDSAAVQRFQREVETAAKLEHEHIVRAYDADEHQGRFYLVLEYVDGVDLSRYVRFHGCLLVPEATECIRQAALGLHYAHDRGIIHRDIKPSNLLLSRHGTVKILDMGLARFENPETPSDLTDSGTMLGTVDYLAPEQAEDARQVDRRSDIYSLGCSLYYLLIGRPMYDVSTNVKKLLAHRDAPIPNLCELRPDVPIEVNAIFQKMVAKNPDDRWNTMAEIASLLSPIPTMSAPLSAMGDQASNDANPTLNDSLEASRDAIGSQLGSKSALVPALDLAALTNPLNPTQIPTMIGAGPPGGARPTENPLLSDSTRAATGAITKTDPLTEPSLGGVGQPLGNTGRWVGIAVAALVLVGVGFLAASMLSGNRPASNSTQANSANPSETGNRSQTNTGSTAGSTGTPTAPGTGSGQPPSVAMVTPGTTSNQNPGNGTTPMTQMESGTSATPPTTPTATIQTPADSSTNPPTTTVVALAPSPPPPSLPDLPGVQPTPPVIEPRTVPTAVAIPRFDLHDEARWPWRETRLPGLVSQPTNIAGVKAWQAYARDLRQEVLAISWSSKAKVAVGTASGEIRIHDGKTWDLQRIFPGHVNGTTQLTWSPKGELLASGGNDGYVRLWSAEGAPGAEFQHPAGTTITALRWQGQGGVLASAGSDFVIRTWTPTGAPGPVMTGHTGLIRDLQWSTDGKLLASAGADKTACVWNSSGTLSTEYRLDNPVRHVSWIMFQPKLVVVDDLGLQKEYDIKAGTQVDKNELGGPSSIADVWNRRNDWVASLINRSIMVRERQGALKFAIPGHGTSVAWEPPQTDRLLAVNLFDTSLSLCAGDAPQQTVIKSQLVPIDDLVWDARGVQAVSGWGGKVYQIDPVRFRLTGANEFQRQPQAHLALSGSREHSALWGSLGQGQIIPQASGTRPINLTTPAQELQQLWNSSAATAAVWSANGEQLLTLHPLTEGQQLTLWDTAGKATQVPMDRFEKESITAVTWHPKAPQFIVATESGKLFRFSTAGEFESDMPGAERGSIRQLSWDSKGETLTVVGEKQVEFLTADGTAAAEPLTLLEPAVDLAWDRQGQQLAIVGRSGELQLVSWPERKVTTSSSPIVQPSAICFSPQGDQLATSNGLGMVTFRETKTLRPLWSIYLTADARALSLTGAGEPISAGPAADEPSKLDVPQIDSEWSQQPDLVYAVLGAAGNWELLAPAEFLALARKK